MTWHRAGKSEDDHVLQAAQLDLHKQIVHMDELRIVSDLLDRLEAGPQLLPALQVLSTLKRSSIIWIAGRRFIV